MNLLDAAGSEMPHRVPTDVLSVQRAAIIERAAAVLGRSRARHYEAAGPQLRRARLEVLYDQIVKAVPNPSTLSAVIFPPCASTICLVIVNPKPGPSCCERWRLLST